MSHEFVELKALSQKGDSPLAISGGVRATYQRSVILDEFCG